MKDSKRNYGEPKGRIFEHAQNNLRDVVVIGKDSDGQPQIWSSLDEQRTNEFLANAGVLEPTT